MNISIDNNNTTREAGTDSILSGTSMSDSCKESTLKSNDDGVCDVNNMLQNMNTADNEVVSVCANCGKEGSNINNVCNKCKQVKYCNAACKKKHRHKHKKDCEEHLRLAAQRAGELHDEELFKQPPPKEDCPLCFLQLPSLIKGCRYQSCCGKVICCGCCYAPVYDDQGNEVNIKKCAFCRVPTPASDEEAMERMKKRFEVDDAYAVYRIGCCYRNGSHGYPRDYTKALELYHRAAELGYSEAYCNIGYAYNNGQGVEMDKKKAKHNYELAAIGGNVSARYNLGNIDARADNMSRAIKHYMIAVRSGDADSVEVIKRFYKNGYATKDDYAIALQSYQAYLGEIKSAQRDKAAAAGEVYSYY